MYADKNGRLSSERVELHLHTTYSAMDGLCDVEEAVYRAAEMGHKAIAITDHGVVQAFPEAALACRKAQRIQPGFKVIYGCEINFVPDDRRRSVSGMETGPESFQMILLAKNQAGLKNLYHIISKSHTTFHQKSEPRVPQALLDKYREGLLVGSAWVQGELGQALFAHGDESTLLAIAEYCDYLEIQPGGSCLEETNQSILALGKILAKPVVAAGNVHFLQAADSIGRAVLYAETGRVEPDQNPPGFLRTTEEMLGEFACLSEQDAFDVVVRYPNQLADRISGEITPIPQGKMLLPVLKGSESMLQNRVWRRARAVYGTPLPRLVEARLEQELDGIIGAGHAVLFVAAWRLTEKSEQAGHPVMSRGLVGASAAAYFSGISEVNPLPPHYLCRRCRYHEFAQNYGVTSGFDLPSKGCPHCGGALYGDGHDIPFEPFLGLDGRKLPDIDLMFAGEYLAQAHRNAIDLFGAENVFYGGTVNRITEKTALGYAGNYCAAYGHVTERDEETHALAHLLTGVKSASGWYPGGLIVVPDGCDIHDFTPVQHPADDAAEDVCITHFELGHLQHVLLKLDLLGHDTPTMLGHLKKRTGIPARDLPMNDKAVYSLLTSPLALGVTAEEIGCETGALGIPELDTPFVWSLLRETRAKSFGDLIKNLGLSRGVGVWFGNAREIIRRGEGTLSDVIAVRDDVLQDLLDKGIGRERAYAIAEQVWKGQAAKKGFDFDTECLLYQHGVPDWYSSSCKKMRYLLPKAHAVSYLIASVRLLYYKLYCPLDFYATLFTVKESKIDWHEIAKDRASVWAHLRQLEEKKGRLRKEENELYTLRLVRECLCRGIGFLPAEPGKSHKTAYSTENGMLRLPLSAVEDR